jgi:hypothetical protein
VRPPFAIQTGSASRSILAKMPASCGGSRLLEHQRAARNQAWCYLQLGESVASIQIKTVLKSVYPVSQNHMFYIELNNCFYCISDESR